MADCAVVLEYRHDAGDTCTGCMGPTAEENAATAPLTHLYLPFEKVEYRRMLKRLAEMGKHYDAKKVIIRRLDRPELFPMQLDDTTVALMKTDMVEFIRSLCHGNDQPIVVDLSKVREAKTRREEAAKRVEGVLVGGYDTLAEAIGDLVFCRKGPKDEIECPLCGRWHQVPESGSVTCAETGINLPSIKKGIWMVISTAFLLNLPVSRYYLPREWNPTRSWIQKNTFTELYRSSLKERAST